MSTENTVNLTYHSTSFSQGKMDFTWEKLTPEERAQAYADWEAGKGLIGGDPQHIPNSEKVPAWGLNLPFFRALNMDDPRSANLPQLKAALASDRPIEIEIGYGRGDFILDRAIRHPDRTFLAYEVKNKATRLFLTRVEKVALKNIWISDDDVRFNLPRLIPDQRLSAIHVLFPDPWWKDQHRVRRIFTPPFVDMLADKLMPGGMLFFKSDVQAYGELVRYLISQQHDFADHDESLAERIGEFVPTHREFWCQRKGKPVHSYYYLRK